MLLRITLVLLLASSALAESGMMKFKTQEIDASLKIGYATLLVDITGDGKPDIVVVDKDRVIWFENPTWKMRTITTAGTTALDNVCIDAYDIDGDGQLDLAMGAGWKAGDTKTPSTLQWLRRGKTLDEPWEIFPIEYAEPTLHRMRWIDVPGSDRKSLLTVPLTGRGSSKEKNWSEAGVKIELRRVPKDPTKDPWPAETINDQLHVAHGFRAMDKQNILLASYEGVSQLAFTGKDWMVVRFANGDQANPAASRGSSEVKFGKLTEEKNYIATIEPWHGNKVVLYIEDDAGIRTRRVIDDQLQWGHAVWCADLDGDGVEELIVGVRDDLPGKAKSGVRIYDPPDWTKFELDPGGVAVEDLAVADLNGDGKPDIVAVGRATKNVRIYWNES